MDWIRTLLVFVLLNAIIGTLSFLIWKKAYKKWESRSKYRLVYVTLKMLPLFFVLPGSLLCLSLRPIRQFMSGLLPAYWGWGSAFAYITMGLGVLYFAGLLLNLSRFIKDAIGLHILLKHNMELQTDDKTQCFEEICNRHSFYRSVRIYENFMLQSPIIVGAFQNNIIFPKTSYSEREFEIILEHEIMHAKHGDLIAKEIFDVLAIVFWFVPAVYKMKHELGDWCETMCDLSVCTGKNAVWTKRQYFEPMFSYLPTRPVFMHTALAFNTDKLELMVRMQRMKAYGGEAVLDADAANRKTILKTIASAACVFLVLLLAFHALQAIHVAANHRDSDVFGKVRGFHVEQRHALVISDDYATGWFYVPEGKSLVLAADVTPVSGSADTLSVHLQGMEEVPQHHSLSGGESFNTYYIQKSGIYRLQISSILDTSYTIDYCVTIR